MAMAYRPKFSVRTPVTGFLAVFSLVFSAMVFTLSSSPAVYAGGAIGGGGDPGGGGGGGQSSNGWGWVNYSVNGNPSPYSFRDGQTWANVSSTCKSAGADRVIAFVFLRSSGTDVATGAVYQYKSSYFNESTNKPTLSAYAYNGDKGGSWLPTKTARSLYDSVDVDKTGFTWGDNVAWFCYSNAKKWTVTPSTHVLIKGSGTGAVDRYESGWSTADKTAVPGQTIYWKHTLQAKGDTIDKRVDWALKGSGFPSDFAIKNTGYKSAGTVTANTKFAVLGKFTDSSQTSSSYTVYQVRASDAGSTLCQHIEWDPKAWDNTGVGSSNEVCVKISYSYSLNPAISLSRSGAIESDSGTMELYPTMSNSGPSVSESVNYELNLIAIQPGGSVSNSAGGNSTNKPCTYFTGTGVSCGLASVTGGPNADSFVFDTDASRGGVPHTYKTRNFTIGNYSAGTRLCFALSVDPRSSAASAAAALAGTDAWRHSPLSCVVVGKQPKVQFWGADVYAGRYISGLTGSVSGTAIIRTANTSNSRGTFGSWGEYAAVASGTITRFGTGAAYADATGTNNEKTTCAASVLAFINAPNGTNCTNTSTIGNYGTSLVADTAASFPAEAGRTLSGNVDLASGAVEGGHVYTATGNITLSSATIPRGKWIVINASNYNVLIDGNITYTNGPFTQLSDIPQVVLIGRNISISDAVTRVDSWLIAKGTNVTTNGVINTCASKSASSRLTISDCNQQLTVNGPVVANRLLLLRTFGAGSGVNAGVPAEIFNLRPDAYVWGYDQANSTRRANTVYLREAPPRL